MDKRLDHRAIAPDAQKAMGALYAYVKQCGLEIALLDMVWLRISQINGCAYCVDQHYRDALDHGVDARKLNSVITWRETAFFTERERAALAWAESLTFLPERGAPQDLYDAALKQFTDKAMVDLTYAIGLMNLLNRLGVGFHLQPAANIGK